MSRNNIKIAPATSPRELTERVLRPFHLAERYQCSAPTIWRMQRDGRLPARDVHLGGKPIGWRLSTLEAAERNTRPA